MRRSLLLVLIVTACSGSVVETTSLPATSSVLPTAPTSSRQQAPGGFPTVPTTPPPSPSAASLPVPTAPPSVVALVVGDFGTGSEAEYAIAERMRFVAVARGARALLTTGDNFYRDDLELVWDRPFGWVNEQGLRVWAAWGNHDIESAARRGAVQEALDPPGRWYQAELEGAFLLVLDANQVHNTEQMSWLRSRLAALANHSVVVLFHQPASSCSMHGTSTAVREAWVPLFEQFDVELVLNGHDHNYQRFGGSPTYVVTGGGGAGLYRVGGCPPGTDPPDVFNDRDHHFVVLTVLAGSLRIEAMGADGAVLDRLDIFP